MILEDPSHTHIIRTGLYSGKAWTALKDFGSFMKSHEIPGEVTRLPTGESIIALSGWFVERASLEPPFWTCCIQTIRAEDTIYRGRHLFPVASIANNNDSMQIVLKIIGRYPVIEAVKAEFVGRPFNPLVVGQLETFERHLEEFYRLGVDRAAIKRQYESLMMDIVDR